ncbi:MAG TPA: hypothetical protein VN814_04670 [Caulobacteraceae bacterium]|nr:hypothetical protein [Caulobacteraceae bacterium]
MSRVARALSASLLAAIVAFAVYPTEPAAAQAPLPDPNAAMAAASAAAARTDAISKALDNLENEAATTCLSEEDAAALDAHINYLSGLLADAMSFEALQDAVVSGLWAASADALGTPDAAAAQGRYQKAFDEEMVSIRHRLARSPPGARNCPPPTGTARLGGGPTIPEPPKPPPPKVPPPGPPSPPAGPASPARPVAPGPPAKDPVKEAADRSRAAAQAEGKAHDQVIKLATGGCTTDEATAKAEYEAARQAANDAITAEADLSAEVQAATAAVKEALNALFGLGVTGSAAEQHAAVSRVNAAQSALDQARDAARSRATERAFPGGRPLLPPGCPPGVQAPEPQPAPESAVPDPNSHSSTLGIRLPPAAQPNRRAGDTDEPAAPP